MPADNNVPTARERGAERGRRVLWTGLANLLARVITALTSFATIPMTAAYLGNERFGLWMTISSFTSLLAFADLGIGNGLLNAVSHASGNDDPVGVRRSISNAAVALSAVAVFVAVVMLLAGLLLDWPALLGLRDRVAIDEVGPALLVFLLCFALGIPLGIVARSQLGLQMGFVNGLWQAAGSLLGLAGVLLVIHMRGALPWLVLALLGGPLLTAAVNALVFFGRTAPHLRPRVVDATRESTRTLLRMGSLFFVLQLAMALAYASDNTIAARLLGAQAVGDYAIAAKLFSISAVVVGLLLQPLWPAYGEAMARHDHDWVRRTLKRSSMLAIGVAIVICVPLFFAFDGITQLWVHRQVDASFWLLAGLAAWAVVDAGGVSLAMFLNGAHVVRLQVILASLFAVTCFALKLALVGQFGVAALPWTTLLVYVPISLVPVLWMMKRWLPKA